MLLLTSKKLFLQNEKKIGILPVFFSFFSNFSILFTSDSHNHIDHTIYKINYVCRSEKKQKQL